MQMSQPPAYLERALLADRSWNSRNVQPRTAHRSPASTRDAISEGSDASSSAVPGDMAVDFRSDTAVILTVREALSTSYETMMGGRTRDDSYSRHPRERIRRRSKDGPWSNPPARAQAASQNTISVRTSAAFWSRIDDASASGIRNVMRQSSSGLTVHSLRQMVRYSGGSRQPFFHIDACSMPPWIASGKMRYTCANAAWMEILLASNTCGRMTYVWC